MPMSARLLRPRQTIHPETADWANRVRTNGGSVSGTTLSAVDRFVKAIHAAGIRDRFYRLNLFAGNSDASLNAVRTPLFRGPSLAGTQYGGTTDTNVNFVAGDYAETGASGGLKGADTASAKRLDTGVAISTLTSTDFHASGYVTLVNTASSFRSFIGASSTNGFLFGQSAAGASPATRFNFLPLNGIAANSHPAGLQFAAQTGNKTGGIYLNGSLAASAYSTADNTDGAFSAGNGSLRNIFVMSENRDGSATGFYRGTLGGYSFGPGMNATQASAFYTAMQAFQTALGRNV